MADEQTEAILDQLRRKSTVTARIGRYVGAVDGQALIDISDQRFTAGWKTAGYVPAINESVWVESIDGRLFMTGPTTPKPGFGVVATVSGQLVTVTTDFGSFTMPYAGTLPASGDPVGITWGETPWCTKLSKNPEQPDAPGSPETGSQVLALTFRAVDAGSTDRHQSRWWSSRPMASESTYGAWFYGTQIKDTIPAGAEFVSLEIYVSWAVRRFGPPRWVLHDLAYKSGLPNVSAYVEWDPTHGSGWFTPPDAAGWFDALKSGGDWWGIGFNQGGWEEARNLVEDADSGALRIKWRT